MSVCGGLVSAGGVICATLKANASGHTLGSVSSRCSTGSASLNAAQYPRFPLRSASPAKGLVRLSGAAAPDNRTKPFAGEAERSGKRGYCAAFNEALPVQQRLETHHKVCALAFAFSAAHIQRAALHSAYRYAVRSATQYAPILSAQARSAA